MGAAVAPGVGCYFFDAGFAGGLGLGDADDVDGDGFVFASRDDAGAADGIDHGSAVSLGAECLLHECGEDRLGGLGHVMQGDGPEVLLGHGVGQVVAEHAAIAFLGGHMPEGYVPDRIPLARITSGIPAVWSDDEEPVEITPAQDDILGAVLGTHPEHGPLAIPQGEIVLPPEIRIPLLAVWDGVVFGLNN